MHTTKVCIVLLLLAVSAAEEKVEPSLALSDQCIANITRSDAILCQRFFEQRCNGEETRKMYDTCKVYIETESCVEAIATRMRESHDMSCSSPFDVSGFFYYPYIGILMISTVVFATLAFVSLCEPVTRLSVSIGRYLVDHRYALAIPVAIYYFLHFWCRFIGHEYEIFDEKNCGSKQNKLSQADCDESKLILSCSCVVPLERIGFWLIKYGQRKIGGMTFIEKIVITTSISDFLVWMGPEKCVFFGGVIATAGHKAMKYCSRRRQLSTPTVPPPPPQPHTKQPPAQERQTTTTTSLSADEFFRKHAFTQRPVALVSSNSRSSSAFSFNSGGGKDPQKKDFPAYQ